MVVIGWGGVLVLGLMLENWSRGNMWWGEFAAGNFWWGCYPVTHTVRGMEWGVKRGLL